MVEYIKKLSQIIEGFSNHYFNTPYDKELAHKKANICATCPLNINNYCSSSTKGKAVKDFKYNDEYRLINNEYNGCGCFIPAKVKSSSQCPLGKFEDI